jgi:cell division septation protein DedD
MEPALKQRLIGAMVLIALAVIFLPMLIKGPAPQSGASDVPLTLPDQPQAGDTETRELPLVTPGDAPQGGMVGMEHPAPADAGAQPAGDGQTLPTVDTAAGRQDTMMRPSTAGGDYAVSFGSYASSSDADRVIAALQAARLPGYQETAAGANGRTVYRVRIGPFATQADAEAARLSSTKVRNDIGAKVVVLNADAADLASPAATPSKPAAPAAKPEPIKLAPPVAQAAKPEPVKPAPAAAAKPEPAKPAPPVAQAPKPAATKPVKIEPLPPEPSKPAPVAAKPAEPAKPAAAGTGFAVQLGAFGNADEANKLRDRARAAGFSAFVEQVRTDKGTLNRVRIGPVVNRADADKLKAQVAGKLGIGDALVKPHP